MSAEMEYSSGEGHIVKFNLLSWEKDMVLEYLNCFLPISYES